MKVSRDWMLTLRQFRLNVDVNWTAALNGSPALRATSIDPENDQKRLFIIKVDFVNIYVHNILNNAAFPEQEIIPCTNAHSYIICKTVCNYRLHTRRCSLERDESCVKCVWLQISAFMFYNKFYKIVSILFICIYTI